MCIGSQDKDMIHFVCPLSASPIGFPVLGSHIRTFEDEMGEPTHSKKRIWARQKKNKTYMAVVCPDNVCEGVSVNRSHKRAVASPEPVARRFPVGENDAQSIGDE